MKTETLNAQRRTPNAKRNRLLQFCVLSSAFCVLSFRPAQAAMGTDKTLYQDSIQTTKESIANETLDLFYHDALDYYHDQRYDEALQLLDKICSINPHYRDAASLRDTIRKKERNTENEKNLDTVHDWMKKGDQALRADQKALAISYWRQALVINPDYAPAQKKIQETNQALAKKEFEAGYIHYH